MNRLIIIGAGGHGRVIADNAIRNGYTAINFIDDNVVGSCMEFPVIGTSADVERLNDGKTDFIIGIGDNSTRRMFADRFQVNWITLVHPSAQIGTSVLIGKGTVIMAGAVVNTFAKVGNHCIINTGAVIEHDNTIEDYVHISPGVKLGGRVHIGQLTHVGIGAVVINNTNIYSDCVIGAGAVVVQEIKHSGTYIGVPARRTI